MTPGVNSRGYIANSYFQTMSLFTWSHDQCDEASIQTNRLPSQGCPMHPVNRERWTKCIQGYMMCHSRWVTTSPYASVDRHRWWWCMHDTFQLRSMSRRRTILPALQAKDSFPTKESSWCFIYLSFLLTDCKAKRRSAFRFSEILAVMHSVSITIPRNVSQVDGPSTLEVLTGALISLHKESIACRLSKHSVVPGKPLVKKSSR